MNSTLPAHRRAGGAEPKPEDQLRNRPPGPPCPFSRQECRARISRTVWDQTRHRIHTRRPRSWAHQGCPSETSGASVATLPRSVRTNRAAAPAVRAMIAATMEVLILVLGAGGGTMPVVRSKWRCLMAALVARIAGSRPVRTRMAYASDSFMPLPIATYGSGSMYDGRSAWPMPRATCRRVIRMFCRVS